MITSIKLIGLIITMLGLSIFISPTFTQKIFIFFKKGNRIYYAGVIRVLTGTLLLGAASQSTVPIAAIALGVMFLVSGVIVFVCNLENMKAFIFAYSQMSTLAIRFLGLVAASFGVVLISIF